MNAEECGRKVASRTILTGVIKSLLNAKGINLEYVMVQQNGILLPMLMWSKKYWSKVHFVQTDNFGGVLDVIKNGNILYTQIQFVFSFSHSFAKI